MLFTGITIGISFKLNNTRILAFYKVYYLKILRKFEKLWILKKVKNYEFWTKRNLKKSNMTSYQKNKKGLSTIHRDVQGFSKVQ